jgi:thiamine kinase-like enzyme
MSDILNIADRFRISGRPVSCQPYGTGHIHDTFLVNCGNDQEPQQYIIQRINTYVFKWPEIIMKNIFRVADHLKKRNKTSAGSLIIPEPILTKDGASLTTDDTGLFYRCFAFIPGTISFDRIEDPLLAFEAARLFGRFIRELSDLPPREIGITIPDFHDLEKRFRSFREAIQSGLPERKQKAAREIEILEHHTGLSSWYEKLVTGYGLPERVCHKDTKINNVLIDKHTRKAVCIIDLDTVMPGSILSDFGDMVRTFTNNADEDEPDTEQVFCNIRIFESLAKGFLTETIPILEKVETDNLVFGAKYLTCMQAVRFLTDYLNGDVYYKIKYEEHNLVRTKNQVKLLQSIEEQEDAMNTFIHGRASEHP